VSLISLKLGYKYLRSNKGGTFSFTTFLAIIGLAIGISSLIVVTSVMNGFEKELEERILGVIPHAVIESESSINNYEALIDDINRNENIIDAVPYISFEGIITSTSKTSGISVIGIDTDKEMNISIISDYMMAGSLSDLEKDNSIIIGSSLAAKIGAFIGDQVNITTAEIKTTLLGSFPKSINLEVIGIYELQTEIDQFLTLISHKTAQKIKMLSLNETIGIRLKTNDLFAADIIAKDLVNSMNNKYTFVSWKNTHGTLFEAIQFEKLLISLMLFLIVAVASILVLSTVIMTVKSKEREIGILMTLGANYRQIVMIFFTQGFLVSLIGIISGIILGFIIIFNLNNFIDLIETLLDRNLLDAYFINYFPYHINYFQILIICLISFLISLFSSLIPSLRALRLNPVEILRHE
jgi:lipoprotein-releasing system permease protein